MLDYIFIAILFLILAIVAFNDFKKLLIPDSCVIALGALGLLGHLLKEEDLFISLIIAVCLSLVIFSIGQGIKYFIGKQPLGFGDIKLFFAAGLWLRFGELPFFLVLSGVSGCLTGLVWMGSGYGKKFPFGPSIIIALILTLIFN